MYNTPTTHTPLAGPHVGIDTKNLILSILICVSLLLIIKFFDWFASLNSFSDKQYGTLTPSKDTSNTILGISRMKKFIGIIIKGPIGILPGSKAQDRLNPRPTPAPIPKPTGTKPVDKKS